jgi:diguanylate cyclase (GGDEF)-like protein
MRTDWNPPAAPAGQQARLGYRTLRAIDHVTGLGNARCWSQRAALMQCDAYWRHEPVALLAVDIDQFTRINNEYGHPAGDDLLRSVGEVLRSATLPTDLVCRSVADEFLILAPGRDADAALELGIRIRDHARLLVTEAMASVDWFVTIADVTVSVGIAVSTDLAATDLLARARGALEHVNSYGHDLICLADPATSADHSLTRQGLSATTCQLNPVHCR